MDGQINEELLPLNWLENYIIPHQFPLIDTELSESYDHYFNPFSQMIFFTFECSSEKVLTFSSILSFCTKNFAENITTEAWKFHLMYALKSNPAFIECSNDIPAKPVSILMYTFEMKSFNI